MRLTRGSDRPTTRRHYAPSSSTGIQGLSPSSSGKGNFGLADIRRMMPLGITSPVHALIHSGVLRDVVPPCTQWSAITMTSSVTFVIVSATSKVNAPSASSTSSRMMHSNRSISVNNTRTTHADCTNETVKADEVPCGGNILKQPPTPTLTAVPGGANERTATLALLPPGLSSSRES